MKNIVFLITTILLFGASVPTSGYPPDQVKGTNGPCQPGR